MNDNKIREIRIIRENPRFRRYPEYKESGVEWSGEIPAHWESKKLGHVSTIFKGGTPKRNVDRYFQGDLPWARPVDITALQGALYIHDTEIHISEEALGNSGARRLPAGTVLLTSRATIGVTAITAVPMATNQGFANFVCNERLLNIYLVYYLQAIKDLLISLGSGSTFLEVTKGTLVGVRIPLPPLSEQRAIVNFLNHKNQQIDELIRIKERRIELLQAQRTALINQAVTKGLDPNVEMKPSGVEWIGEIPAHWEVLKVKQVGLSNPSKNNPKTACLKEKPVVFLPMERVHTDGTIDQELRLPYSQLKNGYTYFEENDVLIAKVTPCFENGKIVLIKNLATPVGFGSTEFIVIRPNPQKVFSLFLYYILYNAPLRNIGKHFMTSAVGLKRVPTEFVENFRIPIPTYQEQAQIVDFLDCKTKQIDELITTEQRKIELLKEYRQSLISEAVTGKIDVRNEV